MSKIGSTLQDIEDGDWITYEILMQHKNMLHEQIDVLLKEKRNAMVAVHRCR